MSQKGFIPLIIVVLLVVFGITVGGAYYLGRSTAPTPQPISSTKPVSTSLPIPPATNKFNEQTSPSPTPTQVSDQTSCKVDDDCMLIDSSKNYACCWANRCGVIDYSKDSWIAVNKEVFIQQRAAACSKGDVFDPQTSVEKTSKALACGPEPGCPSQILNDNFVAKCINNVCTKTPK